ncbi:MAG: hypothetical protein J6S11_02235 [Bacteroidaceae bacterium]|nr:hypothetical protein [Bacteroidaceae bacterium]
MEKKQYIAPEMTIAEYRQEICMLSVSADQSLNGLNDFGGDATGKDADAQGRRGSWGNLWE